MPKSLKSILQFVIFLAIGLGLIWLVTHKLTAAEKADIIDSMRRANYWLLIPVIIVGIASHWYRAVRWKLLMEPLGYHPHTINTFFAVMVGYLVNLAIPRLGEVTRCGIVARYEKIPADKLVGTMIAERAVDLLLLVILMVATVLTQVELVGTYFQAMFQKYISDKMASTGGSKGYILAGAAILLVILAIVAYRIVARSKVGFTIRAIARNIWEGILSIGKMEKKGLFIFYSILIWVFYYAMMYLGFLCMGETSNLGFKAAMTVLAIGSVGMIVTQGGIGAYNLLVQQALILYGVKDTSAYAFSWIVWGAQTLMVLVFGLASVIALPIYNKKKIPAQG